MIISSKKNEAVCTKEALQIPKKPETNKKGHTAESIRERFFIETLLEGGFTVVD